MEWDICVSARVSLKHVVIEAAERFCRGGVFLERGYSKAILNQLPNERETAERTDVESRNHVEAIPAQVEACMVSNGGCFA
ncbi:hypothetical protein TNCV_446861 [Trichonephila clavipes]|nr:hypothetical protein TNCV_446861 [Trichonephila clavipes]